MYGSSSYEASAARAPGVSVGGGGGGVMNLLDLDDEVRQKNAHKRDGG